MTYNIKMAAFGMLAVFVVLLASCSGTSSQTGASDLNVTDAPSISAIPDDLPVIESPVDTETIDGDAIEQDRQVSLTGNQVNKLMRAASAAIGTYGGQCKVWVQNIVRQATGIPVATTKTNQVEWNENGHAYKRAQWWSNYANGRIDNGYVGPYQTYSTWVYIPNWDKQQFILYGSSSLWCWVDGVSGGACVSGDPNGRLSPFFYGSGWHRMSVYNSSRYGRSFTACEFSRSRFESDWGSPRRGDAIQMFMYAGKETPHTCLVQNDFNVENVGGRYNWIDSNWVSPNYVGQHRVSCDQMVKWVLRKPNYGFTVYCLY